MVPAPDPDPGDFRSEVDNPWWPLPVGGTWTYRVSEEGATYDVEVTTSAGPEVLGIATTAVRREPQVGRRQLVSTTTVTDWYAQDRAGNVWWFGREDEWRAGEAGAEAGLAMPAEPRFGDGFRMAVAPGVDVRAEVVELDDDAGVLQLDVYRGETRQEEQYAEDVGLRSWEVPAYGTTGRLVAHDLDG